MKAKTCPVCGANTLTLRERLQVLKESFGGQKEVPINEYYCSTCDSTGDFFNENEEIIENNLKLLKKQSIRNILNGFSDIKISMSGIERALSLPQRTLTKWKNGETNPSSTGLALMKFLGTFPWLLKVAENNFDYNIAQKICISSSIQKLLNSVVFDRKYFAKEVSMTALHSIEIFIQFDQNLDSGHDRDETSGMDDQVLTIVQ